MKRRRYDLHGDLGWAGPLTRVFAKQEALFRYLDDKARTGAEGRALRGWTVEDREPLLRRLKWGETLKAFDDVQDKLVRQKWYFVAATPDDICRYVYGAADDADEFVLGLDGRVTAASPSADGDDDSPRSVYEIIREGTPCRMYLDVELEYDQQDTEQLGDLSWAAQPFADAAAPEVRDSVLTCRRSCGLRHDAQLLESVLLRELDEFCRQVYGLKVRPENVLRLSSQYPHKLSAHFIVHLPDATFRSNAHLGRFVAAFVSHCAEKAASDEEVHRALFFHKRDESVAAARRLDSHTALRFSSSMKRRRDSPGGLNFGRRLTSVIDLAVYTRNRSFRCAGASKLGKQSPLVTQGSLCCMPFFSDEELWRKSLVCAPESSGGRLLEYDCPDESPRKKKPRLVAPGTCTSFGPSAATICTPQRIPGVYAWLSGLLSAQPYRTGSPGKLLLLGGSLVVAVAGSRYCQNVQREHRSNNVYLVLSISRHAVAQRCYDPDCAGYRSPEIQLPLSLTKELAELSSAPQRC